MKVVDEVQISTVEVLLNSRIDLVKQREVYAAMTNSHICRGGLGGKTQTWQPLPNNPVAAP